MHSVVFTAFHNIVKKIKFIKAKFFRLSYDVVTCDVDRDVSTAYCCLLQAMSSTGHA